MNWPATMAAIVVTALGLSFSLLSGCWRKPRYYTKHGMKVFPTRAGLPSKQRMERATTLFIREFMGWVHRNGLLLTTQDVAENLSTLTIEFKDSAIEYGEGKLAAGMWVEGGLRDPKVIVWWKGDFDNSAYYHELLHMIQERMLGWREPDYEHKDKPVWEFADYVKRQWTVAKGAG